VALGRRAPHRQPEAIHEPLATDVTLDKRDAQTRDDAEQLPTQPRVVVGNLRGVIVGRVDSRT
jgi:hypothetical protein